MDMKVPSLSVLGLFVIDGNWPLRPMATPLSPRLYAFEYH